MFIYKKMVNHRFIIWDKRTDFECLRRHMSFFSMSIFITSTVLSSQHRVIPSDTEMALYLPGVRAWWLHTTWEHVQQNYMSLYVTTLFGLTDLFGSLLFMESWSMFCLFGIRVHSFVNTWFVEFGVTRSFFCMFHGCLCTHRFPSSPWSRIHLLHTTHQTQCLPQNCYIEIS